MRAFDAIYVLTCESMRECKGFTAMFRRILVGVAGTPATEAKIDYPVELATRHGATVSAMSVVDVDRLAKVGPVPLEGAHYAKHMRPDRMAKVRQTAQLASERFETAYAEAGVPAEADRPVRTRWCLARTTARRSSARESARRSWRP